MENRLKSFIGTRPNVKRVIHYLMIHPIKIRPRFLLRLFQRLYVKRGRKSIIYNSARMDVVPFHKFSLGRCSVIEDYSIVNNMVGDVVVGNNSRVGISNTIIGPVSIGDNVILAQGVILSGMDHKYEDCNILIREQGITKNEILVNDDVWIGANAVVLKGVTIGSHSIIAANSLVNRDVPSNCVVAGNPARIVKIYNTITCRWDKQ